MSSAPFAVRWTDHATVKAGLLGIAAASVEEVVLDHHAERVRNHRGGDWWVVAHGLAVDYDHPDHGDHSTARIVTLWRQREPSAMKIDGHYDEAADIAWLRFEGYDPSTVVAEEVDAGLREMDPKTGATIGLEYWHASTTLPADLLRMLPPPQLGVAA
jgi:hypothetical protein